jgi:CelD/BcsL family acetyltransferase involved in cellulose biosynthesis
MTTVSSPPARAASGLQLTTARTQAELERIRPAWDELLGDVVYADPDYVESLVRTSAPTARPHVLLAERGDRPEALLVGRLEPVRLPCHLGYKELRLPALRAITVVYGGLLGAASTETIAGMLASLRTSLSTGEADVVILRELRVGSPLHREVGQVAGVLRSRASRRSVHRELTLPDSPEAFLGSLSKSTRDGVKRYRRKLERELGERLEVRQYASPAQLDELVPLLNTVAARSWQRGIGSGFRDDEANRERLALALEQNWLRACVVFAAGEPIAFWHGIGRGGRLISGIPGFDPRYSELRVGTYALVRLIESLTTDPDFTVLDFGLGDAEYKRRFATASWEEESLALFARRPKPYALGLFRAGVRATNDGVRSALGRAGLRDRVRNAWRRSAGESSRPA